MANRTLTMLLGYDPISRLDDGSPSNVDRRTALASPINDLGVRDNLQPTTPMGLIGGTLTQVRTGLLLWCKFQSDWKVVATTGMICISASHLSSSCYVRIYVSVNAELLGYIDAP